MINKYLVAFAMLAGAGSAQAATVVTFDAAPASTGFGSYTEAG